MGHFVKLSCKIPYQNQLILKALLVVNLCPLYVEHSNFSYHVFSAQIDIHY